MFWFKSKTVKGLEFLKGATDIHCHLLPGVDDGMATLSESMELLSLEEVAGLKRAYLTPHNMGLEGAVVDKESYGGHHHHHHHHNAEALVADDGDENASSVVLMERHQKQYEKSEIDGPYAEEPKGGYSTAHLKERFEKFKSFYTGGIELRLASEYMMNKEFLAKVMQKDIITFADGVHVLVETSYFAPPVEMEDILFNLSVQGYQPIIAHPERYRYMSKKDYKTLKEKGYDFQLNFLSLTGYYGPEIYERAIDLLEKGYYNFTGSDFHRISTFYHQMKHLKLKGKMADKLVALFENNSKI